MKSKKFLVLWNADNTKMSEYEINLSESKFSEASGIDGTKIKPPYSYKISSSCKNKILSAIEEFDDRSYYSTIEWREVPESQQECFNTIKNYIRTARGIFEPKDSEISNWMKMKCNSEWLFEKHMKENNLLLAIEELHVIAQCYYGRPLGDQNFTRTLNEARKLALTVLF